MKSTTTVYVPLHGEGRREIETGRHDPTGRHDACGTGGIIGMVDVRTHGRYYATIIPPVVPKLRWYDRIQLRDTNTCIQCDLVRHVSYSMVNTCAHCAVANVISPFRTRFTVTPSSTAVVLRAFVNAATVHSPLLRMSTSLPSRPLSFSSSFSSFSSFSIWAWGKSHLTFPCRHRFVQISDDQERTLPGPTPH